jgi:uncharacterized membrane protein
MKNKVMRVLIKYFINGLLVLTPIMLTIWIIKWVLSAWDKTAGVIFTIDIPGLPLIMSLIVIIVVGYMTSWWISVKVVNSIDRIFYKVPVAQFIYRVIKETLTNLFGEKKAFRKVAVVKIPNTNIKMLGFITSEDLSYLGFNDHVAVYVMQSMQWAGVTLLVPKEDIEILEGVNLEDVMKFIISAGAVQSSS